MFDVLELILDQVLGLVYHEKTDVFLFDVLKQAVLFVHHNKKKLFDFDASYYNVF